MGWRDVLSNSCFWASAALRNSAARLHDFDATKPSPTTATPLLKPLKTFLDSEKPSNPQAHLTEIPVELKLGILYNISKVKTLRSLAIASGTFRDVYENNKKSVLSSIVANEISPVLFPSALIAVKSSELSYTRSSHYEKVDEFLSAVGEEDSDTITPSDTSIKHLLKTSLLHDDVSYLAQGFLKSRSNKLSSLAFSNQDHKSPSGSASVNELRRIHRGFYLLEMFTNLFRHPTWGSDTYEDARIINPEDIANLFLTMFPPYQIEEMVCARDYIFEQLSDVFVGVKRDLSQHPPLFVYVHPSKPTPLLPPGFERLPEFHAGAPWMDPYYDGCLNLSGSYDDMIKETRVMKGLSYICRLLQATTDRQRKNVLFEDLYYDMNNADILKLAIQAPSYDLLHDEESQEAFFHQDAESFETEEEGPNAGWTWANDNKVELRYGQEITQELRDSGYVMWDKSRLEYMGILDVDSSKWRLARDGFKNTRIEHHAYYSRHEEHCLRDEIPKVAADEAETVDAVEELESSTTSPTNIGYSVPSEGEALEEILSVQEGDEASSDESSKEEIEDFVEEEKANVAKHCLTESRPSEGHEINFDDLFENEIFISTDACLKSFNDEIVSDSESDVDLNAEDEDLLSDMQDDLKDEVSVKAISLELYEAVLEAYYSDQDDCSTSKDSMIISDPELANEVDKVIVWTPMTDHADFTVDLDAASESSTSEGPAIITAVDLDVDSKNEPPSQEPANHAADQVVDHPVTRSFAFGSGSLESSIKFSEGWEKVPEQGSSSAFSFKSDGALWKTGETFLLPEVSDISRPRTGSTSTLATNSSCDSDVSTLPSSIAVEKASDQVPFVFGDKPIPGFNFDASKTPTASCSNTTEATAKASFQFGQNSLSEFTLGGAKLPTMPLSSVLTSQSTKLTLSEDIAPLPTPKPRKASSTADSGYGSGMSDKSLSPPPPDFVEWSRPCKKRMPIPNFLAARGITATLILDPTVEDVEDEYDAMLRTNAKAGLEPVWDPAAPEDSPAMKELKVEIAKKEQDKPTEKLEVKKGPVEELEEKKERLRAFVAQQADGRKKNGGKKGKKGKGKKGKNNEGDAGTTVEDTSVDTDSVNETPTEKTATSPVIAEKTSYKVKVQNCKSTGRARFRNGKGGQGLVEPGRASVIS